MCNLCWYKISWQRYEMRDHETLYPKWQQVFHLVPNPNFELSIRKLELGPRTSTDAKGGFKASTLVERVPWMPHGTRARLEIHSSLDQNRAHRLNYKDGELCK
jgi:hypothetical protein